MKDAFRSAFLVTVFTFSSQLVLFVAQIISAALFGASAEMDAFLAANTLPQYIVTVLLGSLGFVFIPFFVDFKSKGMENAAYDLAVTLFNNCVVFLGLITLLGIILTRPLLHLIAPGLSDASLEIAVKVGLITWPTILASGALNLLSSIYQAEKKFGWQAAVPLIGSMFTLLLLVILAPRFGVIGLAIATTLGVVIQVLLLSKIILKKKPYSFKLNWQSAELHRMVSIAAPLIFVSLVTKFTPVIDRYLASTLPEGSISHLNYAFKIITTLALLISIGGTTVIFPKMASDVSGNDVGKLRNTISFGLRTMWFIVAPVVSIGIPLSLPLIITIFNYGEFKASDAMIVAEVFQIYIVALIAMCLGSITSKGFYVLRDSKTLAIMGPIEVVLYAAYTIYLTRWLGVLGIALGYVIYFNVSLGWQLLMLNYRTGAKPGKTIITSFTITLLAAVIGGISTYGITYLTSIAPIQLVAGGLVGIVVYITVLHFLQSAELNMIKALLFQNSKAKL